MSGADEGKQKVHITLDGQRLQVDSGQTIMQVAERLGIRIPRLCHHPELSLSGACRVCIVEVQDTGQYMASCATEVWDGMVVLTNSPEIRQARRDIVELLLDNHPMDCQTCERSGRCELQQLSYSLGVRRRLFEGERKHLPRDESSVSVLREPDRCILCGRCVRVCSEVQGVHNLSQQGRGFLTYVSPAHARPMDDSVCIQCGQCVAVCPTAAFLEKNDTERVWAALADPRKHVVVQTAPAIRATIGEGFGQRPGLDNTHKMVASLRRLGFDAVFDTDFGADLTIIEESLELLRRLELGGPFPLLTSCSPGWVSYMEKFYPELIPLASTCRSPMSMTSVLLKTWYAESKGLDPRDVFVVAIMPCVAKKYEAARSEHQFAEGIPYTDAVLTTREAIWMLKSNGIDYWNLSALEYQDLRDDFDDPLGESSGAGAIFGATGGVMEATLRTAAARLMPDGARLEFRDVRNVDGVREAEVELGGQSLRVAVANGLRNASQLFEELARKEKQFHVVEVMACPGGCVGGGGQPYPPVGTKVLDAELLRARAAALYRVDADKAVRRSHENPSIQRLYAEFLGEPGGPKAQALLHTRYAPKVPRGIR
jgi:iron-only hydrogenase group A